MDKSTGFVQTAIAATRDFGMYRSTHLDEGRPDTPQVWLRAGTCIDWYQRHVRVLSARCFLAV